MNKKRQTIWLVSMLSIMVVLSAYYLFTEDTGKNDNIDTASDQNWNSMVVDMLSDSGEYDFSTSLDLDSDQLDGELDDTATMDDDDADHEHSSSTSMDSGDYDFESQAVSSADFFIGLEMAREDFFAQEIERLHEIANNPEQSNKDVAAAMEQIETLRTQQEKMDNIEERLNQHYDRAVILQQQDKWQVIVQADKLEKSEAVSIFELVMSELNVDQSSVSLALKN